MFLLVFSFTINFVQAASIEISQAGADSNTVMKGKTFTLTVSGLSSSGTVTLVYDNTTFSMSESSTKSFASGTTSVSWTTMVANTKASGKIISATISVAGSPSTATSNSFGIILPPSLSAVVDPSSTSVAKGSTFTLSLNIQNSGETAARFGSITVSPSEFSISSGCSPSEISGGQSAGISCTILASSSASSGTLTLTISPTNTDSLQKTVSVTVTTGLITTTTSSGGEGGAGAGLGTTTTTLPAVVQEANIPNISAGGTGKVSFTNIPITDIAIEVKNAVQNVKITIIKTDAQPATVAIASPGQTYAYLSIDKANINDSDITNVKIKFKVEKSWISSNNIDITKIALYRYSDGQWTKLPTVKLSEDSTYIYFEATSPGLSAFAISGELMPTAKATTTTTTIPSQKTLPKLTIAYSLTIIVVAIVVIVLLVIAFRKK